MGDPRITTDRPTTQLREARTLQRIIFAQAQDPMIKPVDLSALARAWSALQESIRVLRGIPLPGQLRPDGLPTKRGKRGAVIELARPEAIAATEQPSAAQPPKPPVAESTRPTTGDTKPADPAEDTPESS